MTVRAELEELVKWISELQKKEAPPAAEHLSRDAWRAIGNDLRRASETFHKAHGVLDTRPHAKVLAELTRDLEGEAEALALRARVLSRRVPRTQPSEPKPGRASVVSGDVADRTTEREEAKADEATNAGETAKAEGAAKKAEAAAKKAEEAAKKAEEAAKKAEEVSNAEEAANAEETAKTGEAEASKFEPDEVAELLNSAQGTLETAHEKLDEAKNPDELAQGFEGELDTLAEMTLSLRQQVRRLTNAKGDG